MFWLSMVCLALTEARLDFLKQFEQSWRKVRTFQAKFNQVQENTLLKLDPETTEGVLYLSKPDRMRIENHTEKQWHLFDGKNLTIIKLSKNEDEGNRIETLGIQEKDIPPIFKFLMGKRPFGEYYSLSKSQDKEGTVLLYFSDKVSKDSYIAEIEKKSYVLKSLEIVTKTTRTKLVLSEFVTNPVFKMSLFRYSKQPNDVTIENN